MNDDFSFLGGWWHIGGSRVFLFIGGEAVLLVQVVQFIVYADTEGLALHPAAIRQGRVVRLFGCCDPVSIDLVESSTMSKWERVSERMENEGERERILTEL